MGLQALSQMLLQRRYPRLFTSRYFFSTPVEWLAKDVWARAMSYTEYLSEKEIIKISETRLGQLIEYARHNVPFYKEYLADITSLKDFFSFSPISKEKMRIEFEKGTVLNPMLKGSEIPQYTSGSTGIPFSFFLDKIMLIKRAAVYRRMLRWTGKTRNDVIVLLMPKQHPGLESENVFIRCGEPQDIEKILPELHRIIAVRPVILQSRPSYLVHLAQLLERNGKRLRPKSLISYTEQLFPSVRAYLEKNFCAPVFDYYACNEITAIGQECEMREGFHINSEWVYVEIVDEKFQHVPPGQTGDIIVTSFDNEVMPFIKYKLGDRGYWLPDPCRCGRALPRIIAQGKEAHSFLLPNGKIGHFSALWWPISPLIPKISQYQIIRFSREKFAIKIVPSRRLRENDKEFIISKLRIYLGPSVKISLEIVDKIPATPGGKQYGFINQHPDYL